MIAAEIFIRGLLFAALAFAIWHGGKWLLSRFAEADDAIERGRRMVERHRARGHQPFFTLGVAVQCECGYSHVTPIADTSGMSDTAIISAYRGAQDEFWATHIADVRTTDGEVAA